MDLEYLVNFSKVFKIEEKSTLETFLSLEVSSPTDFCKFDTKVNKMIRDL